MGLQRRSGIRCSCAEVSSGLSTDTALETELTRVAFTSKSRSNQKVVYVADFAPGVGTGALTEVGVFNAAAAGDLLSRITFPVKNKGAGDSLQITIEHTYARQ